MDALHLSQRLKLVADLVPYGSRVADIGSDHAYLPAYMILNHQIDFAVAGEVVKGPFENAQQEVTKHQLTGSLVPRLADGLAAIEADDHINVITICGMGGSLISQILDAHPEKLVGVKRLVLQPNVGEGELRSWLVQHHYEIMTERLITEDDQFYEIIVAEPTQVPVAYNQRELTFGPELIMHQGPVFQAKWQQEIDRLKQVISQMQNAKQPPVDKIKQYQAQVKLIQEVLTDDNRNYLN